MTQLPAAASRAVGDGSSRGPNSNLTLASQSNACYSIAAWTGDTRHAFVAHHAEQPHIDGPFSSPRPRHRVVRCSRVEVGCLPDPRHLVLHAPSRVLPTFRWPPASLVHHLVSRLFPAFCLYFSAPVPVPPHLPWARGRTDQHHGSGSRRGPGDCPGLV